MMIEANQIDFREVPRDIYGVIIWARVANELKYCLCVVP